MKKILITGASGFIGNFFIDEALKRGYEVYATIRKTSKIEHLKDKKVQFVEVDFSDKEGLYFIMKSLPQFDYIIHNAGLTKALNKKDYYTVNYELTKNFVDAILESGKIPTRFLYMSSLAAYGPGNAKTLKPISLADIPSPVTHYGRSKLATEGYLQTQTNLPFIILRPTAVYGPGERDIFQSIKIISRRFDLQIGSHKQFLTFIYVKDLVKTALDLLESAALNQAYFISDGNVYSKKQLGQFVGKFLHKKVFSIAVPLFLVKIIAFIVEKSAKLFKTSAPALNVEKINELAATNWLCDVLPLTNNVHFNPEYHLEKGLFETMAWYKKEGWI